MSELTQDPKTAEVSETEQVSEEEQTSGKKKFFTEARLEIFIAILLGITAFLSAWANWISSLHGGNQATNYTKSNNLATEGNADWNEASQTLMQDMLVWNTIMDYKFDISIAVMNGDDAEADLITDKVQVLMQNNCSEQLLGAIDWALEQGEDVSPFDKDGLIDSYFDDAREKIADAQILLEQGMQDNANGDKYGLVGVIFSLVLFLLGIVGIFKRLPNRVLLVTISIVFLIAATIYMLTIPLPTGFAMANYF